MVYHIVNVPWKKKFLVLKMLLAKRVYDPEGLKWEEGILIKEYFHDLWDSKNVDIVTTTRFKLGRLKHFAETISVHHDSPPLGRENIHKVKSHIFTMRELPDEYAYFGWKTFWQLSKFFFRGNKARCRIRKNKRFLGVGYKDKGNRKNVAEDGSPSWQEVASSQEYKTKWEEYEADDRYFDYRRLIKMGWLAGTHPKWE